MGKKSTNKKTDERQQEVNDSPPEESKSVVVAKDLLPETLPMVPLYQRPMFPKMVGPIMVENEGLIKTILESADKSEPKYIGLVFVHTDENEPLIPQITPETCCKVGTAAKILQVSNHHKGMPLQVLVQVLERFDIREIISEKPILLARVHYWRDTQFETNKELKAYSVAIIESIRELVKLNPLFKEGLSQTWI